MTLIRRAVPQPLTAIVFSGAAVLILLLAWTDALLGSAADLAVSTLLLAALLGGSLVMAGLYPIHIRYHTKICLTTAPLYIMAVLLPPPLVAWSVCLSMLIKGLLTRAQRQNTYSDVATATSRWVVVAYVSALVAHMVSNESLGLPLLLLLTAMVMLAGDVVTAPFEIAPMCGEPRWQIMRALITEGGLLEGVQYLLGMLGVIAALQQTWALALLALPTLIVYIAFKNAKEMQDATRKTLESMADAVDLRDPYTGGHSRRVGELCASILREMNVFGIERDLIVAAARVHDIGKLGIPDEILLKPAALTPAEFTVMQTHAARGAELLARYQDFVRGAGIVRHHHERWDGNGYPAGLKEYEIPFGGRVIAVADGFDTMISNRPYRNGMSVAQAALILREERGRQWDVAVVDALLRVIAVQQAAPSPAAARSDGEFASPARALA